MRCTPPTAPVVARGLSSRCPRSTRAAGSETGQGGPRDLLVPGVLVGIVLASLAYDAIVGEAKPPPCPRDDPAVTTVFVEDGGVLHEHGRRHLPDGLTVDCTLTPPPSSDR